MALPSPWIYVATAEARDDEMAERIAQHRARRGHGWPTVEAPLDLALPLETAPAGAPVLVDCLTLWLSNRMLAEADVDAEIDTSGGGAGSPHAARWCWSPTRSASASCPTMRSPAAFATCRAGSTSASPRAPTAWSSWSPDCRSREVKP